MIQIPEDGWGFGPASDQPRPGAETLLTGWPAPRNDGYLVVPGAEFWGMQPQTEDDPVRRADTLRERAGAVFKRQRAVGAFSRNLDDLFTTVTEDSDWSKGLEHFDRSLAELRRKHADGLEAPEDREAFERHAGQFGAMQRIDLKRALVERQQADALSQLDEQLAYYAGKAATAPNDVFRSIAVDSGLQAIAELREAGYLFPEAAQRLETAFRGRLDSADLESIVKADPQNAAAILDDMRLFPNAGEELREKLRRALTPSAEPAARENDDIAQMLAPLVEGNEGLRDLLDELEGDPDDPGALVQLATNLLDGDLALPEANRGKFLEQILRDLLRRGGDLLKRRPRDPDGEPPRQLPPPKQDGEKPQPLPPAPPRISRPKADPPLVEPPKEDAGPASTYSPTKPIGIGEKRYKLLGNRDFVQYEDGSFDFGGISQEITADIAARKGVDIDAAPVRLPKGKPNTTGELHMERGGKAEELRRAGYASAAEFVDDVGHNFSEIWMDRDERLLLIKRGDGERSPMFFVELKKPLSGSYYEVKSGGNWQSTYTNTRRSESDSEERLVLLWRRATSSSATGELEPLPEAPTK